MATSKVKVKPKATATPQVPEEENLMAGLVQGKPRAPRKYLGVGKHDLRITDYRWHVGSNPQKRSAGPMVVFEVLDSENEADPPNDVETGDEVSLLANVYAQTQYQFRCREIWSILSPVMEGLGYEVGDDDDPFSDLTLTVTQDDDTEVEVPLGTAMRNHVELIKELLVGKRVSCRGMLKHYEDKKTGEQKTATNLYYDVVDETTDEA